MSDLNPPDSDFGTPATPKEDALFFGGCMAGLAVWVTAIIILFTEYI